MRQTAVEILNKLHEDLKISDEAIALKFEVSSMTVYRWRKGKSKPSHYEFMALERLARSIKPGNSIQQVETIQEKIK